MVIEANRQSWYFLRGVIRSQPGSDDASRAHELLSRIYLRSGQYARLIDNLDQWAATFPYRREVQDEKADVEQLRGLPDQRNGPLRVSTLRHDAGDDWSVPVSIDGKPASYLLDSGAWISVISESEAKRLGLEIRAGSGTLSDPSGKGVTVRTAVAREVRLGAMTFQDVSFAVLSSDDRFAILGVPIWCAVRHVKWSSRGTWELGGRSGAVDRTSRNVVFSGNHLLLATSVSGTRVFSTLDTGAVRHRLEPEFLRAIPGARPERDPGDPRDYRGWRDGCRHLHHGVRGAVSDWPDAGRASPGSCHVAADRGDRRLLLHR